ncbi:MAG TPA: hypothetical protein VJ385_22115 [Fibrobacteria bacterium]|nr:hypothetical protein [Fibrobacteria bacterium]
MSCEHACGKPAGFPEAVANRPGLEALRYRIGSYAAMRAWLLEALDAEPLLRDFTHRGADDPGIALLEGAALVGDVLTFYQELYANEAYLRTARWAESVADLVRLTGYRLAPGLGGRAAFALAVKGSKPVTVPAGLRLQAKLEGRPKPDDFETASPLVAYPHLSRFRPHRKALPAAQIGRGTDLLRLELKTVDGKGTDADLDGAGLKAGDKLYLLPDSGMWDETGTPFRAQGQPEIVTLAKVEKSLGRFILHLKQPLGVPRAVTSIRAYRVDRSFRHFGAAAPPTTVVFDAATSETRVHGTDFERDIYGTHQRATPANHYPALAATEMPLEGKVDGLRPGGILVCEGLVHFPLSGGERRFATAKTIREIRADSLNWGALSGPATVVEVDRKLVANDTILDERADIRRLTFHEATSRELILAAPTAFSEGKAGQRDLRFFGAPAEARPLQGRELILAHDDGRRQKVVVTRVQAASPTFRYVNPAAAPALSFSSHSAPAAAAFSLSQMAAHILPLSELRADSSAMARLEGLGRGPDDPRLWILVLDRDPDFPLGDFDAAAGAVWAYGNVVEATQGKTEAETVLGDGDARQAFQTFPLPKAPLTYLLDPGAEPPQRPELEVHVDGIRWHRADTFFGRGPEEHVYIVREEGDKSHVQFGDGKHGARLPSGLGNVKARYRTGTGAHGPLASGQTPQGSAPPGLPRISELDKVYLPMPVTGGAAAESADNARAAAPGKLQSLGRMVGLADYEAEALSLPGVVKARALWGLRDGVPAIKTILLTESRLPEDLQAAEAALRKADHCRGPARFPLAVEGGRRRYVYLRLVVGRDPDRREEDILAGIETALGLMGSAGDPPDVPGPDAGPRGPVGLFALVARGFGQSAHISQVLAAAQGVPGVAWVEAKAAQALPAGPGGAEADPETLAAPALPRKHAHLNCGEAEILSLHPRHLSLSLVQESKPEGCA